MSASNFFTQPEATAARIRIRCHSFSQSLRPGFQVKFRTLSHKSIGKSRRTIILFIPDSRLTKTESVFGSWSRSVTRRVYRRPELNLKQINTEICNVSMWKFPHVLRPRLTVAALYKSVRNPTKTF